MACLAAKPAVDGLERQYAGRATVLRADILSEAGRTLARRYDIDVVPGFVVLAGDGTVVWSDSGMRGAPVAEMRAQLRRAGVEP